jgi:carboxylesterase type B
LNAANSAASVALAAFDNATALTSQIEPFLPTEGTGVVDGQFDRLLKQGSLPNAGIPLMIGNVENEGNYFVPAIPGLQNPVNFSLPLFESLVKFGFPNDTATAILQNYDSLFAINTMDVDGLRDALGQLVTLTNWQCPLQQLLGIAQNQSTFSSLYSYRFDRAYPFSSNLPSSCLPGNPSGVDHTCHAEDVPSVFGTLNVIGRNLNSTDLGYLQYVVDSWSSFIRQRNPSPDVAYLMARGRGYEQTLAYTQQVPFEVFPSIHHFDAPPNNTGLVYPQQCDVLAKAGFLYDGING